MLITEHNEDGAMGLVLNRPSEARVADAVPDLAWVARRRRRGSSTSAARWRPNGVIVLAEWDDPSHAVVLVEATSASSPATPRTGRARRAVRRARVYAGHAGWGPGQLEDELDEEAWIVEAPQREELFSDEPGGPVGRGAAPQGAGVRAALDDAARSVAELES